MRRLIRIALHRRLISIYGKFSLSASTVPLLLDVVKFTRFVYEIVFFNFIVEKGQLLRQ